MRYVLVIIIICCGLILLVCLNKKSIAPATHSFQSLDQYYQSQGVKTPLIPQPNAPSPSVQTQPPPAIKPKAHRFVVYTVKAAKDDHFVPSGWMGDYGDVMMSDPFSGNCHSQNGCIEFNYNAQKVQGAGWAGIYWQNPANNWGDKEGGYNLVGMKRLTFWARGEKGGEQIDTFIIGGISGKYPDSAKVKMGPVKLTSQWKEYTIDLTGKDLSYISGGFGWMTSAGLNPEGCTFYLDSIQFEGDPVSAEKD